MDQIKIGKFIATLRKEQNMTQRELADLLGITDRAVSKWENGRGLPELSLLKPLCDALSISINELLNGERIEKELLNEKAEETIINTLQYSKKSIKKTKKVFYSILAAIIAFFILLVTLFAIDIHRMQNQLPVVFSTWGLDYAPPVDLEQEELELAVKNYIITNDDSDPKHHEGEKAFAAFRTYLIEELNAGTRYNIYAWVLGEKYYSENGEIKEDSGYFIPHKFTVTQEDGEYTVIDAQIPRDGSYYVKDMKTLFPRRVRKEMENVHQDGTYERLKLQIEEQVKLYFHK